VSTLDVVYRGAEALRLSVAILAAVLLTSCGGTASGPGPTVHIDNIDGPTVRLVAWSGAPAVVVPCGGTSVVPPTGAPALPWDLEVYNAANSQVLFSHSVAEPGDLYLLVRSGGVLWGMSPGSGGPAPLGCH
jgi:hypothetical protein